jgi:hypothetical protein
MLWTLGLSHPATFSHSSHCFREKIDQEHDIGDANVTVAIFADELGFVWVVTYQVEEGRVVGKGGVATCQLPVAGPCVAA